MIVRLAVLVFALFFSLEAQAGEACTDACSGNFGPDPCGAFGLGCPPGGGQCIQCRNDNDCQPGGNCLMPDQRCINLPCSPMQDAGGPPAGDASTSDAAGGDQGVAVCICDVDFTCSNNCPCDPECADASTPIGDDASDSGPIDNDGALPDSASPRSDGSGGGGGAARDPREGCSCRTSHSGSIFGGVLLGFLGLVLRRRSRG